MVKTTQITHIYKSPFGHRFSLTILSEHEYPGDSPLQEVVPILAYDVKEDGTTDQVMITFITPVVGTVVVQTDWLKAYYHSFNYAKMIDEQLIRQGVWATQSVLVMAAVLVDDPNATTEANSRLEKFLQP